MKHEYIETHVKKHEYTEGPEATANFETVARAVLRPRAKVEQVKAHQKKQALKRTTGKDEA